MRIPTLEGVIRRRILVNYRVDPAVIAKVLPARFKPKLYRGNAVAGICLIRLEHLRPKAFPELIGLRSENAAHRIAVCWNDELGNSRDGVFIPRRDTDSRLNHWLGGRLFPGEHHHSTFSTREDNDRLCLKMTSTDRAMTIEVEGRVADALPSTSVFESVSAASSFFEAGSLGYSPTRNPCRFDGIVLDVRHWRVQPLTTSKVYSSYFADQSIFPAASVKFDHALFMHDLAHQWHSAPDLPARRVTLAASSPAPGRSAPGTSACRGSPGSRTSRGRPPCPWWPRAPRE